MITQRAGGLGVPAVALTFVAAVALGLPRAKQPGTTYASVSATADHLGLLAGIALIAAGGFVATQQTGRGIALLALLTGAVWFSPDVVGWQSAAPAARSVAAVLALFLPCLLLDLLVRVLRMGTARLLVLVGYLTTGLIAIGIAVVRDPFLDQNCWSMCTGDVFLIRAEPRLAKTLVAIGHWWWATLAVVTLVVIATRLTTRPRMSARGMPPVLVAGAVTAVVEIGYAGLALSRTETSTDQVFVRAYLIRSVAWTALAFAIAWAGWRAARPRRMVTRLATRLRASPAPGSLASSLADSMGDPRLTIRYPLAADEGYVDAHGRLVPAVDVGHDQVRTTLSRGGRPIAVLAHDPSLLSPDAIEAQLGPAALVAIDNERLAAELNARVQELRASQARIVETGDQSRRRLERDLHDGAQQRILAVSYELRLARASAAARGEQAAAGVLDQGIAETLAALGELRELAHGIHPTILSEAGLAAAVRSLGDTAPVNVRATELTEERFGDSVELAAYAAVCEAVSTSTREVSVTARHEGNFLVVDTSGEPITASVQLTDRIGALGGTIARTSNGMCAEIPCES
jgi:signal transduction histidine kinase